MDCHCCWPAGSCRDCRRAFSPGPATATLIDLAPAGGRGRATLVATVANMGALGSGPLLGGLLSQFAGSPLRLTFWVDLVPGAGRGAGHLGDARTRHDDKHPRLRPQIPKIPKEMRSIFTDAALAGIAGFAVLGLFTAVTPDFLGQGPRRHEPRDRGSRRVLRVRRVDRRAGWPSQLLRERAAIPTGAAALIVGMASLALGLIVSSLVLLVLGSVIAGLGQGLSFRGGLTQVGDHSPAAQRGEVTSAFFVVMYIAISLPVIGEGLLAAGDRPARRRGDICRAGCRTVRRGADPVTATGSQAGPSRRDLSTARERRIPRLDDAALARRSLMSATVPWRDSHHRRRARARPPRTSSQKSDSGDCRASSAGE